MTRARDDGLGQSPTVGEVAALRQVGLMCSGPVVASVVVRLPHVFDTTGPTAPAIRGGSRVDLEVAARRRLLDGLLDHAGRDGLAGLVGVRHQQRALSIGPKSSLWTAVELCVGAIPVRSAGRPTSTRPFRTALGGVDVAALLNAGWRPVDLLIVGTTEIRASRHRAADAVAATSRDNRELPGPTDMLRRARTALRGRLQLQAAALRADGVLLHDGFDTTWSSTYHLVQVSAAATAIARTSPSSDEARTVLSMR